MNSPVSVVNDGNDLYDLSLTEDELNMSKCVNNKIYQTEFDQKQRKPDGKTSQTLCNETIQEVDKKKEKNGSIISKFFSSIFKKKKEEKQKEINIFINFYKKIKEERMKNENSSEKDFWKEESKKGVYEFNNEERYRFRVLCTCYNEGKQEEVKKFIEKNFPDFTLDKCNPIRLSPKEVLPTKTVEYLKAVKYLKDNSSRMSDDPRYLQAKEDVKYYEQLEKNKENLEKYVYNKKGGKRTKKYYKKSKKANTRKHKKSKKVTFKKNKKTRKH